MNNIRFGYKKTASSFFSLNAVNLILFLVLIGVVLIYRPALNGPFVFDDIANLVENYPLHLSSLNFEEISAALISVQAGPFGRPIAYLSFALNYFFFGAESFSFKLVNVFIHLLNGICVFVLTKLLLRGHRLYRKINLDNQRIQWISLAVASLWILHPLALTSVLYIVQRMASLAALFSFLTLIFYFSGRLKQFTGRSGTFQFIAAFGLFAPLAVFSKDNAILIPYFLLVTDWILLGLKTRSKSGLMTTRGLLVISVLPLFAGLSIWDNFLASLMAGYEIRPFTLYEHVLTESRVLWFYMKLIFIPNPADFGLYHDDFALSKGLFQPFSTIVSIVGLAILATGAVLLRKKVPVISFAILFFLVGHSIESSIFSLEIAHEHRNYFPMYGMIFMFAYYGLHPKLIEYGGAKVVVGFIALVGLFAIITLNRAMDWTDNGRLSFSLAEHHPNSARSNYEAGRLLTQLVEDDFQSPENESYYKLAREYFKLAYQSDEFNPGGLFGILYLDGLTRKATDQNVVALLIHRLSTHPILPATATSFTNLHKCYEGGYCQIKSDIMIRLYESALSNKQASSKTHASLANELAILNLEQGNDETAIELFNQSIKLTPNQPQLRFNLIQVLIDRGRIEDARRELDLIRENFLNVQEQNKRIRLEKMYLEASRSSSD